MSYLNALKILALLSLVFELSPASYDGYFFKHLNLDSDSVEQAVEIRLKMTRYRYLNFFVVKIIINIKVKFIKVKRYFLLCCCENSFKRIYEITVFLWLFCGWQWLFCAFELYYVDWIQL